MLFPCSLRKNPLAIVVLMLCIYSCKTSGPGLFGKKSPHDQYGDRITNAGLRSTALGHSWFSTAAQSISSPLTISIPYKETGYFSAETAQAAGLRFTGSQGQKIKISLERKPSTNFTIYMDLWKSADDGNLKHIASADTLTNSIQTEVDQNTTYTLRIQPELLSSGEYSVTISAGPSLAYPIRAPGKNHIQSFWGAARDGGARKHEGIDMFASFRTPVVAAANGTITRVDETNIGGKVVWLRPEGRDYTLYYAHLDEQLVRDGETVKVGDTLGLMGNTGNAKSTSPHLHFGIYTFRGPVDPLPFVNPVEMIPEKVSASTKLLGKLARNNSRQANVYSEPKTGTPIVRMEANTLVKIEAAAANWYRIRLPDGTRGFIDGAGVAEADKSLRKFKVTDELALLATPDSLAPKKISIPAGETVDILANFNDFYFVNTRKNVSGWITIER